MRARCGARAYERLPLPALATARGGDFQSRAESTAFQAVVVQPGWLQALGSGLSLKPPRVERYNSTFVMLVARRFVVSGRVQGVGFRYFTQETALREGATGWVRNLPDGRVEALVEGEAEAVTRIERALRSGPRGARVERVYVDVEDPSGAYDTFSVTS